MKAQLPDCDTLLQHGTSGRVKSSISGKKHQREATRRLITCNGTKSPLPACRDPQCEWPLSCGTERYSSRPNESGYGRMDLIHVAVCSNYTGHKGPPHNVPCFGFSWWDSSKRPFTETPCMNGPPVAIKLGGCPISLQVLSVKSRNCNGTKPGEPKTSIRASVSMEVNYFYVVIIFVSLKT